MQWLKTLTGGGRESQFELLRLVAQYLIVLYHLLLICVVPFNGNIYLKALEIPLHIGVILFILLSVYFGIRPTSKGFLKLMTVLLVYSIPEVCFKMADGSSLKASVGSLLFFSRTHFWFIRTYVFLYLLSPMVNGYIKMMNERQLLYILCVLFFISIYVGTVGGDVTLGNGKNAVNFIFLYLVGSTLHSHMQRFDNISIKKLIATFILFNMALVIGYAATAENIVGKIIWHLSFPYSSPLLLVNSIIFFLAFSKMSFHSKTINWLAKSSLAIYLIHGNRPLSLGWSGSVDKYPDGIIVNMMRHVCDYAANDFILVLLMLVATVIIIFMCIAIDKMLTPIWNKSNSVYNRIYAHLGY